MRLLREKPTALGAMRWYEDGDGAVHVTITADGVVYPGRVLGPDDLAIEPRDLVYALDVATRLPIPVQP